MTRVYNFSAGPACLPEWVLTKAASEMLDRQLLVIFIHLYKKSLPNKSKG